jgi:hypothetical protein
MQGKCVFFTHCTCCYAQVLGMKKNKSKIGQCCDIGEFCPPAAALPELMGGNLFESLCCMIKSGGGECNQQNWQEGTPPLPKLVFLFLGFVFGSTGSAGKLPKKKRSETARPQLRLWQKIRVNPN